MDNPNSLQSLNDRDLYGDSVSEVSMPLLLKLPVLIMRYATVLILCLFSAVLLAECRDLAAIEAANKKALSYFKDGSVFHGAVIQKVHHPSRKKEVASYIKTGEKHYSIFTLVDEDCGVVFRKRTRQWD